MIRLIIALFLLSTSVALAQNGQPAFPTTFTLGSTVVGLGGTTTTVGGLTLASPTFSGTVAGNGTVPLAVLAGLGTNQGTFLASSLTVNGALKLNGTGTPSQAACADLSNAAASCSTDTTSATNITTGTLPAAQGGFSQTAYATSTPTPTPGSGSFTATSAVHTKTQGKTTFLNVQVTVSNAGTASGAIVVTTPTSAAFNTACSAVDQSNGGITMMAQIISGTLSIIPTAGVISANTYYASCVYENS